VTTGLMLAGAMTTTSAGAAEITFGGDARARFHALDNYQGVTQMAPKDSDESFWSSRVRLQFQINTKGGAYAVGRFSLTDGIWDGQSGAEGSSLAYGKKSNLDVDIGYIGVPLGPIVVEAGTGYNTMNQFIRADDAYDFLRAVYATKTTTVVAFIEKLSEYQENTTTDPLTGEKVPLLDENGRQVIDNNFTTDNDIDQYGVNLIQRFDNGWKMNAVFFYRNNQQDNKDSMAGDVLFDGRVGDIRLFAEIAYKEADYQDTDNDGVGGYVAVKMPLGIASVSVLAGATSNGFTASGNFGGDSQEYAPFVMLSKANSDVLGMLNTGVLIGSPTGNSYFFNVAPSIRVSDKLTLTAESTYMNADYGDSNLNIVEVGGIAQYKVSDGATITALLGYLDIENADKNPLGFGLALDLAF